MDHSPGELQQLRRDLLEIDDAIQSRCHEATSWHLRAGPIDLRRRISSQTTFCLYVLVNAVLFAGGIGMTFSDSPMRELGIAITVGVIFAISSFLNQFWALTLQREERIIQPILWDTQITELKRLLRRRESLAQRIADLDGSSPH